VKLHDTVIHESEAARIDAVLHRFLSDANSSAAVLIDRSGQPLAEAGTARSLDVGSIGALAAAAFSSTAALAQLLGESEFSVLFHEGVKESLHVSTVDEHTILLAIFAETRKRPKLVGVLATPLTDEEARRASDHRPA
jgi:predicted regulator of Ras-like GTPase activity (Roadblock/LC7/MglB family)